MLLLHRALLSVGGAPAGGGGWTPADLGTDLAAWYDASDYSSITESSGLVSQWNDISGNSLNLTSSGSLRPTYSATSFNSSYPGISFNSDLLSRTAFSGFNSVSAASVFVVASMDSGTLSDGRLVIYKDGTFDYDSTNDGIFLYRVSAGNEIGGYRVAPKGKHSVSLSTFYRLGSIFDGTNHTAYKDNVASTTGASSGTFASNGAFVLGASNESVASDYWVGVLGEVIVVKKALNSTERDDLDAYLVAKWGL